MRRRAGSRACRSAPTIMWPSRSSRANWSLRIGNILKRTAPPPVETLEQVAFGPYVYHLERGELRQGDEVIHLTDREREMLRILAVDAGRNRAAQRADRRRQPSTSARSTCRSTVCGARSSAIPPIPCSCRRCAASAIAWSPRLRAQAIPMSTLDTGLTLIRTASPARLRRQWLDGQCVQGLDADRALCPRAADHDRADGGAAIGGGVRVHGAALEHGDAAAVGRRGAGHRRPDRRL